MFDEKDWEVFKQKLKKRTGIDLDLYKDNFKNSVYVALCKLFNDNKKPVNINHKEHYDFQWLIINWITSIFIFIYLLLIHCNN